jgi:hypothetical protein
MDDAPSTTKLGDWYGNLVSVGRRRVVLFVSERSRLPVLLPARDVATVAQQLPLALEQMLPILGVPRDIVRQEVSAMTEVHFAPTANRSILGTMTGYHQSLRFYLGSGSWAELLRISLHMSETPIGPLDYQVPWELALQILTWDAVLPQGAAIRRVRQGGGWRPSENVAHAPRHGSRGEE